MKDLKHIRRFNESEENLNISDVSDRIFNRQREIDRLKLKLEELKKETKHLSRDEFGRKYKHIFVELNNKINTLEHRNKLLKYKLEILTSYNNSKKD